MHRFGVDPYLPFDNRVATVAELCRRRWAGQMVLSHDAKIRRHVEPAKQEHQHVERTLNPAR